MDKLTKILSQISPDYIGHHFCCKRGPSGGYQDSECLCSRLPCDAACHNSCYSRTTFTYPESMCTCGEPGDSTPKRCCEIKARLYLYIRDRCKRQLDNASRNPCDQRACRSLSECHARVIKDPSYLRILESLSQCMIEK